MVRKETTKDRAGECENPKNMAWGLGLEQVNRIQDVLYGVWGRAFWVEGTV